DASKALVKLLRRHALVTGGRVNHIHIAGSPALNNQEVIELPVNNGGQAHEAQVVLLHGDGSHAQAIAAGRIDNGEGRKPVAPNTMILRYLRDAGFAPIIAENHRQAGGPTRYGVHLHKLWHAAAKPA